MRKRDLRYFVRLRATMQCDAIFTETKDYPIPVYLNTAVKHFAANKSSVNKIGTFCKPKIHSEGICAL